MRAATPLQKPERDCGYTVSDGPLLRIPSGIMWIRIYPDQDKESATGSIRIRIGANTKSLLKSK